MTSLGMQPVGDDARLRWLPPVVLIAVLILSACTSDAGEATTTTLPDAATSLPVDATSVPETSLPDRDEDAWSPDDPVGQQMDWIMAVLGGEPVTEADVEERFADSFLDAAPAGDVVATLSAMSPPGGLIEVVDYLEPVPGTAAEAVIAAAGQTGQLRIQIRVGAEPPHEIVELRLIPEEGEAPAAEASSLTNEWNSVIDDWSALAPQHGLLAAEIVDGACVPVAEVNPDAPYAVASAFKLYVLGALVDAVDSGAAAWDEELPIRDELRSPGGPLALVSTGHKLSLRDLARRMIADSDNTATDHLIDRLSRERVEEALADYGHSRPEVNMPLLTTNEMTVLKFGDDDELRERFMAADPAERRQILVSSVGGPVDPAALASEGEPRYIAELEWFGSVNDLCRVMAGLLSSTAPTEASDLVGQILAADRTVSAGPDSWAYAGYKGGYEPGVLSMTWALQSDGRRTFVLAGVLNDETEDVDAVRAAGVMDRAGRLILG